MLSILFFYGGLSLLIMRLVLGVIFIVHGWPKIKNLKGNAAWFASVGFKPGIFWGTLAACLEFCGGIALVVGVYVHLITLLLGLQFLTIIAWKLMKRMAFTGNGGWELDLIILAGLIVLLFLGGGAHSLDRFFFIGI